jgi:hypothetical protein
LRLRASVATRALHKIDRNVALVISIAMMALPAFLIGLLPTYQQIGVAATADLAADFGRDVPLRNSSQRMSICINKTLRRAKRHDTSSFV